MEILNYKNVVITRTEDGDAPDEGSVYYSLFLDGEKVKGVELYAWANTWREIAQEAGDFLLEACRLVGGEIPAKLVEAQRGYKYLLLPGQEGYEKDGLPVSITSESASRLAMSWYTHGNFARSCDFE